MRKDLAPETLYPHEIPLDWLIDILSFFVGILVFVMLLWLVPIIAGSIVGAIPPEHGVIRLHRPKYSRFLKERYLKWGKYERSPP